MAESGFKVVVVDRQAWYEPIIESEELSKVGARVVVGWAVDPNAPPEANLGCPEDAQARAYLSKVTAGYYAPRGITEEMALRVAADADGIIVMRVPVTGELMDAMPKLRVIGRSGIGVDNVDVDAATERGIAVVNTPGFCAREVADHTMLLVLGCARKLSILQALMREGDFDRGKASPMNAVYSRTLGLIAFGEIAREVALRARPFGFRLLAHDPYVDPAVAERYGVELVTMDRLLAESDFVSVHAPLNAETRHLVGERELSLMRPTACVINTARGPVIDEAALVRALREGRIAGAGLDVVEREPMDSSNPLLGMPNVLITPHMAGLSDESQFEVRRMVSRAMAEVLVGGWPSGRELNNPAVKTRPRRPA